MKAKCPHCAAVESYADDLAGLNMPCRRCDQLFMAPSREEVEEKARQEARAEEASRQAKEQEDEILARHRAVVHEHKAAVTKRELKLESGRWGFGETVWGVIVVLVIGILVALALAHDAPYGAKAVRVTLMGAPVVRWLLFALFVVVLIVGGLVIASFRHLSDQVGELLRRLRERDEREE